MSRRLSAPMASEPKLSLKTARAVLGIGPFFTAGELRRAFREAAKQAHPDRAGGGAERFRQVVEAYHRLQVVQAGGTDRIVQPPAPRPPEPTELRVDPWSPCAAGLPTTCWAMAAACGSSRRRACARATPCASAFGPRRRPHRHAGDARARRRPVEAPVSIRVCWTRAGAWPSRRRLARRIVWLTKKAGERKLVRLQGPACRPADRTARATPSCGSPRPRPARPTPPPAPCCAVSPPPGRRRYRGRLDLGGARVDPGRIAHAPSDPARRRPDRTLPRHSRPSRGLPRRRTPPGRHEPDRRLARRRSQAAGAGHRFGIPRPGTARSR